MNSSHNCPSGIGMGCRGPAVQALQRAAEVIWDDGIWGKDTESAIRGLLRSCGAETPRVLVTRELFMMLMAEHADRIWRKQTDGTRAELNGDLTGSFQPSPSDLVRFKNVVSNWRGEVSLQDRESILLQTLKLAGFSISRGGVQL